MRNAPTVIGQVATQSAPSAKNGIQPKPEPGGLFWVFFKRLTRAGHWLARSIRAALAAALAAALRAGSSRAPPSPSRRARLAARCGQSRLQRPALALGELICQTRCATGWLADQASGRPASLASRSEAKGNKTQPAGARRSNKSRQKPDYGCSAYTAASRITSRQRPDLAPPKIRRPDKRRQRR